MRNSRAMGGRGGGEQPAVQGQPRRGRAAASESHEQPWLLVSSSAWGCLGEMAEERVVGDAYR